MSQGVLLTFVRGCSAPKSQPLPFCIPLLTKKVPLHLPKIKTLHPFCTLIHVVMKKERQKKNTFGLINEQFLLSNLYNT